MSEIIKAQVILSRYAISPEPSNRTYRLCVKPFFTFVTLCLLCNFSCFCWRLLAFFKFNFFLSILIWVHTDCIGCQLSLILSHAPKIYVDEGSGQTLWEVCIIAYASSECQDEPIHSHSVITAFAAWTEKKKRCRWRFWPNFVPSKAVVLLLLIHSLMFLPLVCRGSVFGPRFTIHNLVFGLVLQLS